MLFNLANILVFLGLAVFLVAAVLGLGWLLRPHTPDSEKSKIYECGEVPLVQAWVNFNPRFYIVAIVFLIFDVEIAFTYPIVTALRRWVAEGAGAVAFLELSIFLVVLAVGLAYVWRKGDLEWIRTVASPGERETGAAEPPQGTPVDKVA